MGHTEFMRIAVAGGTGTVGRHVVEVAREQGHEVVVLSRSTGVDLVAGTGLAAALEGVDAVIDVTSKGTQSAAESERFFGAVTRNLLAAEQSAGVGHHLALGIVGSLDAPFGYYAGKKAQEELVAGGPVPWTILRATQFHEFASQIYGGITAGPFILVPKMTSQPVAAREVAERLVELTARPAGRVADLAGPAVESMARMVRTWARAVGKRGPIVEVPVPGGFGKAMRDGTLVAGAGADVGRQSFDEWVAAL